MRYGNGLPVGFHIDVTTQGQPPGIDDFVRDKIGGLSRFTHLPILHARVRLSRHADPAVARPVIARSKPRRQRPGRPGPGSGRERSRGG